MSHTAAPLAGVRVIAEQPQHTLNMVGSDDGESWWFLTGICHDETGKGMFRFDFSPKGGPSDLTAKWDHFSKITFPDGNVWTMVPCTNPNLKTDQQKAACAATAAPFMDVAGAIDGPLQHLPARRV